MIGEAIRFDIPGPPQGKSRPRATSRGGFVRFYTPAKTVSYEGQIAFAAKVAMHNRELLDCAVRVELEICCPIPASWSQRKRAEAAAGGIWPTTKPDTDNVVKAVFDACNGVVWRDDVVVVKLELVKRYALMPRVSVAVEPMPGQSVTSPLPLLDPAEVF